jgi:acetyl esterase/lipase
MSKSINPVGTMPLAEADEKLKFIQKMLFEKSNGSMYVNSFDPAFPPQKTVRDDGIIIENDIKYGEQFPNSYLDVYYKESDTPRPTYFYFHGGGFFMGHKHIGDPIAIKTADNLSFISVLVENGFNVVNVDYALTPDYRFPVQLIQMNDAIEFMIDHKEQWGIDDRNIIIGGGSAGADMSEIYGMMLVDEEYASAIGINCAVTKEQVKGLVLDEPALSITTFNNENMYAMFEGWTGEEDVVNGKYSKLLDVPKHIKDEFIPSFIIASNAEPFFYEHCKELSDLLNRIGVYHEFVYPDPSLGVFQHGFMSNYATNEIIGNYFEKEVAFMKKCVKNT